MPDRGKVIKSLKWFRDRDKWREGIMIHDDHAEVRKQICDNAIELLKEPEAKQIDLYGNDEWWGLVCVCPDCNAEWMTDKANTHYCPNCGIRVKWE